MFNVRVYSFLMHEGQVLVLKEPFAGQLVHKLPGGGLELGEGTVDCLRREYLEELNLELEKAEHLYTLDYYVPSKQTKGQFLPIYYITTVKDVTKLQLLDKSIEEAVWVPLNGFKPEFLDLEVDRYALKLLLEKTDN